jgi:hypothetical protein
MKVHSLALGLLCSHWGCSSDPAAEAVQPDFPANYASSYEEVRDCRRSGDHDLNYVRILTDPEGFAAYRDREDDFPEGSIVLKEEYDFADTECSGGIQKWTAMERLPKGSAPNTLDWAWQEVDASRTVVGGEITGCVGCHRSCQGPNGFNGTCADP